VRESRPTRRFSLSRNFCFRERHLLTLLTLAVLLTLSSDSLAFSQGPLVLTDDHGEYPLGLHLEILEDKDKKWTIDDVTSAEIARQFVPSQEKVPSFGLTDSAFWARLRIRNEASQTPQWWLEVDTPAMSYVDLYLPATEEQNFEVRRTGYSLPFSTREMAHHNFVFNLTVPLQTEQTIYLRFETGAITTLPLILWSPDAFVQQDQTEQLVWGAYYGVFLVMMGYNAFLYLSLREKSYLYYVLYVAAIFLIRFSSDGRAKQYLWPNLITWGRLVIPISIGLGLILSLQFTRVFLTTRDTIPRAHALFRVLIILLVLAILLVPLVKYRVIVSLMLLFSFAVIPMLFTAGVMAWRQGYRPARYFVLAFSIPFVRNLFEILVLFNFLPQQNWIDKTEPLAFPLLATLLSLALADRINVIKQERELAQSELVREQEEALQLKDQFTAALQESEEKYRSLIENSGDAVYLLYEQRFEVINAKFSELFGVTAEDVQAPEFDFMTLVAPKSHLLVEDRTRRLAQGEDLSARYEFTALNKDGNEIEVEVVTSYIAYRGGIATQGILRDITARKRAEAEREQLLAQIREQGLRLRQIMNTVPEGVLLLDMDGRVLLANPIAEGYLNTLAEAKVGDVITQLGDRSLNELLTSPTTKGFWHEVSVDGRIFEILARPIENGPQPKGWVLVLRDVTRARELREQGRRQERLAAVGQLAAGIAHDFNNIMGVIVLYSQLSRTVPDLPPKVRERLQIIDRQAKHASDLITQIMDFSRSAVLERKALDLSLLVREQVKLLERTLPENIRIRVNYGKDDYSIDADLTRIQQMIMNLAVNARDAISPQESGELRIALSRMAGEERTRCTTCGKAISGRDGWVKLEISDNGSGIPKAVLPYIFDPFFTTKERGQGTGLGLAQVYGIVKQHGGHVSVVTQVGKGTTFSVYLPAITLIGESDAMTRPPQELPEGQGELVLVVEDNLELRKSLVQSLTELDYQTLEAANGREALALFAQHADQISLVLSDLVMPSMGGRALFYALKERDPAVKMVLLTGHPMEEELGELEAQGLSNWLLKPVSLEQLAQLLARELE